VNVVDFHSPDSPIISAVTKGPPSPVVKLQAKNRQARKVPLTWTPVNEEEVKGYSIYRANQRNGPYKEIAFVKGKDAKHYLDKGEKYFYRVRAIDKDNLVGKFSDPVRSMTKPLPSKPKGLTIDFDNGQIKLSWHKNPEMDIAHYQVFKKAFFSWEKVGETIDPIFFYKDELKEGKTLVFMVKAADTSKMVSEPSEEISYLVPK